MILEVLICTYGNDGINRVAKMNLPKVEHVKYLVSWQTNEINIILPNELHRNDLRVYTTASKGLSNNRNHSINKATGDICLIADDDITYTSEQLLAIINTFKQNPDTDIALFRHSGNNYKQYPDYEFNLNDKIPQAYYISSVEIAFRRTSIPSSLQFDTRFGVGTSMPSGEEFLFIHQAMNHGLKCRFFPITITHHEGLTTGSRQYSNGVLQANGVCLAVGYSFGILRIPIIAWRLHRDGKAIFFPAVHNLLKGYIYGKKNFQKR